MSSYSDRVWNILVCPHCRADLRQTDHGASCVGCGEDYPRCGSGSLDLRLRRPKSQSHEFSLGTPLLPEDGFPFDTLQQNNFPEVDYSNFKVPSHLSREFMSHFPRAKTRASLALDLGCGDMVHKEVCEHAGFEHVGLDYEADEAQIRGDAHALPFRDSSFEFILCLSVLEHIRFPFVAMREAHRVLQPGGVFLGSVAFLEPFHADSFYHHTHLGTYNSLKEGGFNVDIICPSSDWTVLEAQATLGLFPRMPSVLAKAIVTPVRILHRLWWGLAGYVSDRASESIRIRNTTGGFAFIARK